MYMVCASRESWMRGMVGPMAGWRHAVHSALWTGLLLTACSLQSVSSTTPEFDQLRYVETLYELQNTQKTLVTFNCTDADPSDVPVVSLPNGGVTPASPCGSCFSVLPCDTDAYCLVFSPLEPLDAQRVNNYYITVECTDGSDTVTAIADIRLTYNTPPVFNMSAASTTYSLSKVTQRKAGVLIYDVVAHDDQDDFITFSMTSDPATDNFEIVSNGTTGSIRAKNDLGAECLNFVTFQVTMSDGYNPPVGPMPVHVTLQDGKQSPDITNLDLSLQVPEDTAVGDVIRQVTASDADTTQNKLTYTLAAKPPANLAYFQLDGDTIKLNAPLDYENPSLRNTNLTIVASDGTCTSQEHYVYVTVTDVNEPPDIQPENAAYSVYEGSDLSSQLTINWDILDEDGTGTKTHTFAIIDGNDDNMFSIDYYTGQLSVNGDYDIDNDNMPTNRTLRVQVMDKGGLTDNTSVTLNFKDRNDNRPVINSGDTTFSVCENRRLGANLGKMYCHDEDSSFQGNNVTYFTGGGGGLTVLGNGEIIMNSRPALGQTITTTAYCHDRGTWPGPLQSVAPKVISLTTTACTTPVRQRTVITNAPTTAAPPFTTTPAATTTPKPIIDDSSSWVEENLPWIIMAALLATALLALLTYMCLVYCWRYCTRCWRQQCCPRRPPRPRRLKTPPKKITPVEEPSKPPAPPPTPPPAVVGSPDGYIYDFWKERYPDDDYGKQPNRKANPRPVTPPDAGNSPALNGSEAAPKKSPSFAPSCS